MTPDEIEEFRAAGHRLVDRMAAYLEGAAREPVTDMTDPAALTKLFAEPLPRAGRPMNDLLDDLDRRLLPHVTGLSHPGYMGLITPSPAPAGILGDFVASTLNQNPAVWSIGPASVVVERQVVRWLTDLVGFGTDAGGNLTSGGMTANFIGLKVARDRISGDTAQTTGVREPWVVYTSEERHVSVDKAVDAIGLGREQLRVLPTDDTFALRLDALEKALADDRRAGLRPMAIVAMGGSTNNGAVDDLAALRAIADREGLWLHVDAAYGGGMLLSRRHRGTLAGIERADSVTIDPHKWFYAPLDAGAILLRDGSQLYRSFGIAPPYLKSEQDPRDGRFDWYLHGFEQSRRFRALKVWMSFQRYGADTIGDWVDANVDQARHLHARAAAHGDFEAATFPKMSAICLRYRPAGVSEAQLDALHPVVARRIEAGGRFWFSTTVLKGRHWFRINPVNRETTIATIDALFDTLAAECARAVAES